MATQDGPEGLSDRVLRELGVDPVGSYPLATAPDDADALLALLLHGPKRATAGPLAEAAPRQPRPQPGRHWIVLDGQQTPRCLVRTEEVRTAPLYTVDAAFAWEHGEGDRTRRSWLAAREDALRGQGVTDLESEPIVFERFALVWPRPDTHHWWLPGVREVRGHEPLPDGPRPDLPALAAFDGDAVTGVLRFEPEPDSLRVVTVTADAPRTEQLLREALALRAAAARSRR